MKPFSSILLLLLATPLTIASAEVEKVAFPHAADMVRATFVADSLCLGPHWIYDTEKIAEIYPEGINELDAPHSVYHPSKQAGDLTHYGDQTLLLLQHLAERGSWDSDVWLDAWQAYWLGEPVSYLDAATRDTLENLASGQRAPSDSHDLSAASRMAPLILFMQGRPIEEAVAAVRSQAASTHGKPAVIDSTEFFLRMIQAVSQGQGYEKSIAIAAASGAYSDRFKSNLVTSLPAKPTEAIAAGDYYGQSCDVESALPLTLWLALAYEHDPVAMLQQNAAAGGDSSARGMLLGMLIAAKGQYPSLPESWQTELNAASEIESAIDLISDYLGETDS